MRSRIFGDQGLGDTLLHEQAGTGATDLSLIEPDSIYQAFDGAVEIGIFEYYEWRLAAQFERKPLVTIRGGAADCAADFR